MVRRQVFPSCCCSAGALNSPCLFITLLISCNHYLEELLVNLNFLNFRIKNAVHSISGDGILLANVSYGTCIEANILKTCNRTQHVSM